MIVNLRGSGGSGKSFVGHSLVDRYGFDVVADPIGGDYNKNKKRSKVIGHRCRGDLVVAGRYTSDCGGVEGFPTANLERQLIEELATQHDHVFFEGLFVSLTVGPWVDAFRRLEKAGLGPVKVLVLDTPADVCLQRMRGRQEGKGKDGSNKVINIDATITKNHSRMPRVWQRMREEGIDCDWVDHRYAMETVEETLRKGGWND